MLPQLVNLPRARALMERAGASLTGLEQDWVTSVAEHRDSVAARTVHALGRATRDAGLGGANVITDDARVAGSLDAQGVHCASVRDYASLYNKIRKIKTKPEIVLMKMATLK